MAAQSGTAYFRGSRSRQTYIQSLYFDDTAGNLVRWGAGTKAGANSPLDWTPPEHVWLTDLVLVAATGQTTTQIQRNSIPTGDYITNALHLASVTTRPALAVFFPSGVKAQMVQIA